MMASRESDERLLEMVRMRADGVKLVEIGRAFEITSANVGLRVNAVRDADRAHSGGEFDAGAYW